VCSSIQESRGRGIRGRPELYTGRRKARIHETGKGKSVKILGNRCSVRGCMSARAGGTGNRKSSLGVVSGRRNSKVNNGN